MYIPVSETRGVAARANFALFPEISLLGRATLGFRDGKTRELERGIRKTETEGEAGFNVLLVKVTVVNEEAKRTSVCQSWVDDHGDGETDPSV